MLPCSLSHGAVKPILTNKQLSHSKGTQTLSNTLFFHIVLWTLFQLFHFFTHSKDCTCLVKPICYLAICTPIWQSNGGTFCLPDNFIMGFMELPPPPLSHKPSRRTQFHQQRAQQNRGPAKLAVEGAYWKLPFLLLADGGLFHAIIFFILCLGSFRKAQSIGLSCFPWEIIPWPNIPTFAKCFQIAVYSPTPVLSFIPSLLVSYTSLSQLIQNLSHSREKTLSSLGGRIQGLT